MDILKIEIILKLYQPLDTISVMIVASEILCFRTMLTAQKCICIYFRLSWLMDPPTLGNPFPSP